MQESPFYELVMQRGDERGDERGIEQGARQTYIESILTTLKARFPNDDVDPLISRLEDIVDNDLKQVNLNASLTLSFLEFQKTLP